ncbi:MAG: pyridoxal phosphate-dependent decarboxylase family protein [Myxococcota bacterium]
MDIDAFRKWAHTAVDWMADYLDTLEDRRVTPDVEPGELRAEFEATPPLEGESFLDIFQDFRETIVPGMTHWNHPGWFGYFPANNSPPSILAEMLVATIGAQCMSWETSPAATELEETVMDWLAQMLELPDGFTGVIQDTASTSSMVALLTAREEKTGHEFGLKGAAAANADRLVVYTSDQSHSSIAKGAKLAGFGLDHVREIASNETFAMRSEELRSAIERDIADGLIPCCVNATVGTTSTTGIDDLEAIGPICDEFDVWLHVDAAYAGSAAILPELRHILDGIEYADSFVFNPHKWLQTNFDCSAYFVRDVDALLHTFQASPEYLKTRHDEDVSNFRDWGIQLGRRFRALKLWFVIRSYGVEGLRTLIRKHIGLAQELRVWLEAEPDVEIMAPSPFGLVCFRFNPDTVAEPDLNDFNEAILEEVNADGRVYLTRTKLDGRFTIRFSIGAWLTEQEHVERGWALIRETADAMLETNSIANP